MMPSRVWVLLLVVLLAGAGRAAGQPQVAARAFVLLEAHTGQVLARRQADLPWPPASTTKILTALLVVESLEPGTWVTVSRRAAALRSGAAVGLRAGERRTVEELLYAMLLASANDAAVALAEAAAGSVEAFVDRMNRRARQLGARSSHFTNPHGLWDPQHRATAYDLALLARAALANPRVAAAVATREYAFPGAFGPQRLVNRNRLLFTYPGANGVKTGWVGPSGPCLVASARRGSRTLVAVLLDSPAVFEEAARLLDFGFSGFQLHVLARPGEAVASTEVDGRLLRATVQEEVAWAAPKGSRVEGRAVWRPDLHPRLEAGQPVGWLQVVVDGQVQRQAGLVALDLVPPGRGGVWEWLWERLRGR